MILVFNEDDLIAGLEDTSIRNIDLSSFRLINRQSIMTANVILYVESKTKSLRILKHRYLSDYGGVFPISDMNDILLDYINRSTSLGKSNFIPGTKKLRK